MLSSFATYYICVSEDEKKRAIGLKMAKKEKILVINNGIDRDHIRTHLKSINKFSIRKYWGMEGDKVILGTLARLDFQKGLDILLRFIGLQKKKDNNLPFKIYIAGDGEEKEKLLKMVIGLGIDGDVIFCGEISRPIDFLASLDIYISFSRGEGLPLSVLEAMSCSLPCLLSDSPGHRSIAMNGGASLFSLDSFDDFDRKMCLLTDSLETRIKWGKQALACVSDNYTLKRMGEQTLAVYDLLQNGQID